MAFFSAVATGVSIWAIIWVKRTWKETKRSADVTREIGEAQVRAYLSCVGAEYWIYRNSIQVQPILFNSGQSPARLVRLAARVIVRSDKTYQSSPSEGYSEAIPAGGHGKGRLLWLHEEFEPDIFKLISVLEYPFSVDCRLTWVDVFDKEKTVTFSLDHDIGRGPSPERVGGDGPLCTGTLTAFNRSGDWNSEP